MKKAIGYLPTGEISFEYTLGDSDPLPQGSIEVSDEVGWGSHWVSEGVVKKYSNEAMALKATPPSTHHVWVPNLMGWHDPRTLADLKAARWALIKQARDAQEFGGFLHAGQRYDSDQISQQRIGQAAQLAMLSVSNALPFSIQWTLEDNSVATLDALQMIAVGVAMGEHINAAHSHSRELRLALDVANSANEIDAVVW